MLRTHGRILVLLGLAATLSGCGEFAYKTGAGADQLATDEKTCHQTADFKACMHGKGWSITNLDADAPDAAPAVAGAPAASAPMTSSPGTPAPLAGATPAPAAAVANPLAPVAMSAWVHFGGGTPEDAIAECVATLGPAHRPDKVHKTVTRALIRCMREKDWRAL